MNGRPIGESLGAVIGLFAVFGALAFLVQLCGCFLLPHAAPAVDTAAYADALSKCRETGRIAKSYEVYESCAKAADRKYGYDGGAP